MQVLQSLTFGQARSYLPGTGLAILVALAATSVSTLHGGPQLLYALLFGVAFHYLSEEPRTRPGIEFCSRAILRLGVGLLGARITAAAPYGLQPLLAACAGSQVSAILRPSGLSGTLM